MGSSGLPLIIIGAGLLADEARPIARTMDGLEVRLRNVLAWGGPGGSERRGPRGWA